MKNTAAALLFVLSTFVSTTQAQDVREVLEASDFTGGLVVVVGCDNPAFLAELGAEKSFLTQGLDADPGKVADARRYLQEKGCYGRVTVSRMQGRQLPYIRSMVNVVVVSDSDYPALAKEIARVLCPNGMVVKLDPETRSPSLCGRSHAPIRMDDWTHYLYDGTNNAVSSDTLVAPPRGLQWTCGPEYARSHEHFGSVSAMVSTHGRVFYIIDEGPISSVFLPPKWKLVARDAFSGVLLWQHPIKNWESQLRGFRSGPPEIGRRLVAVWDHVYVTLGYGEPVTVLDSATGKPCRVLAGTEGATELLYQGVTPPGAYTGSGPLFQDRTLYVLADDMTTEDHEERKKWINETAPTLSSYQFPKRAIPMYGKQRIVAIDAESGKRRWTRECGAAGEVMPTTLAIAHDRLCYQSGSHVVCLNAKDGTDVWRSSRPVARSRFSWSTPTLVVHHGVVLTADRVATDKADNAPPEEGSKWLLDNAHQTKKQPAEMVAFSIDDGKELWRAPYFENYDTQLDVFVIGGVVWTGDLRHKGDAGFTEGRDLKTGKVVAQIPHNKELYNLQMGHHRCHRNKATFRYLLLGRDGIEFVDLKAGTGDGNWWVRGTCQYGIMPANGLIYAPQHSCACHPNEKLIGMNALSPRSGADGDPATAQNPLEKGPAYITAANLKSEIINLKSGDWPTYRRDARRSGFQDLPAPRTVGTAWTKQLTAPVTAPVVTVDNVFVAEIDQHTLHALSTQDGKPLWSFVADGRIDSPPTIASGLCLFGTRNGFVYCLQATDGKLVWRFRAGPHQRRIFSYEQLESVWPVHGSVLVDGSSADQAPLVYFAAGRSSHLDGGIRLYALELKTGNVVHQATVSMTAGDEGAEVDQGVIQQRVLPDVLSSQRGSIFMRDLRLDKDLAPQQEKLAHLFAPGGFLDDTWWHRTYWIYGTTMMSAWGGWPRVGNMVPAGRMLAFDGGETIYGYGRMTYRAGGGHVHPDPTKDYQLFAEVLAPKPQPQPAAGVKKARRAPAPRRQIQWSTNLPFVARSIVLTQDALLVAGGRSLTETAEDHGPGTFWIASRADGKKLGTCQLSAPPILDAIALTDSGVYVSAIDGSVICLRAAD